MDGGDEFQGGVLLVKFNRNEKSNEEDVRRAVLMMQREKRGGAKKTGKKNENRKIATPRGPIQLFNACPSETACFVRLQSDIFFLHHHYPQCLGPRIH